MTPERRALVAILTEQAHVQSLLFLMLRHLRNHIADPEALYSELRSAVELQDRGSPVPPDTERDKTTLLLLAGVSEALGLPGSGGAGTGGKGRA